MKGRNIGRVRKFSGICVCPFLMATLLVACNGEDRSGEMPRVPVVQTLSAVVGDSCCTMVGRVDESHNSTLKECGFLYGNVNDGTALKLKADTMKTFTAKADSLANGNYYCIAYARNGMGISYGDTVKFEIEP